MKWYDFFALSSTDSMGFVGKALIISFLLVGICTSEIEPNNQVYYKMPGKLLRAPPFKVTQDCTEETCLATCLHTEKCKSFNLRGGSANQSAFCEYFDVDRCEQTTSLINGISVYYFDAIPDRKCKSEWFVELLFCRIHYLIHQSTKLKKSSRQNTSILWPQT